MYNMIAYAIHWLKHLYTSIKKKKTDQAGLRFYNWLQKASICSNMSMRQQRACETEAIILPPNKRHFNFTLTLVVFSSQECRIAHPIVKCTFCRSEFQQERWDSHIDNQGGKLSLCSPATVSAVHISMLMEDLSFFSAKPTLSVRNVHRMSNSLER